VTRHVYENVKYYGSVFDKLGMTPEDMSPSRTCAPCPSPTRRPSAPLPFGMFRRPDGRNQEIHASSGTTGKPTVVAYTESGPAGVVRGHGKEHPPAAGGNREDIIQNAYGYGLFTGGLGVHYGALELGAAVVPMSSGGTQRQLQLMQDFGTTSSPAPFLFRLHGGAGQGRGHGPRHSTLRIGILGAEPWSEGMRREIESAWDIKAYDIYGLSEIIGPAWPWNARARTDCTSGPIISTRR